MLISGPPQVVFGAGSIPCHPLACRFGCRLCCITASYKLKFEQGESPALYVSCDTAYTLPCGLGHFPPLGGGVIKNAS